MINIYFGNVVDVNDEERINRVRVSINGYTDNIPVESLPWYYPFLGVDYLPRINDTVPVLIFNGNFMHGFYNNRNIDVTSSNDENETTKLDGTEYENYLEIYKRAGIELSYKESVGIQLINANSRLQIENDRASMYVEDNQITMNNKRIDLGTDGEATPLGDKTVKLLKDIIASNKTMHEEYMKIFDAIQKACKSPVTKPIGLAIQLTSLQPKQTTPKLFEKNTKTADTIQSKKTFIE